MGKIKIKCCNPTGNKKHQKFVSTFPITKSVVDAAEKIGIQIDCRKEICSACRHNIYARSEQKSRKTKTTTEITGVSAPLKTACMEYFDYGIDTESAENSENHSSNGNGNGNDNFENDDIDIESVKDCVNGLLNLLNLDELSSKKMRSKKFQEDIFSKLMRRLNQFVFPKVTAAIDNTKIIEQLKNKFEQTNDRNTKIKILSVLPADWSIRKTQKIFANASYYMINQTKKLVKKNGILCDTTKKIGTKISEITLKKVKEFYYRDEISRSCPGMREYQTYKENGERLRLQRRLVLMNLHEAYMLFKSKHPNDKIGFSKFAALRPPECVLANSAHGIHTTCVCLYHQNAKLIVHGLQKIGIVDRTQKYRDVMEMLLCTEPEDKCRLNECNLCPGIEGNENNVGLRTILLNRFEDNIIEDITIRQWVNAGSE